MSIFIHEIKEGLKALVIWTFAIVFTLGICIFIFPSMKESMEAISQTFASLGSFTKAFGLDKVGFGTLIGFYSIECGSILGLGGAFFATTLGASALSKEEKDGTAEFLLSHPISRPRIITEKIISVIVQIIIMNLVIWICTIVSIAIIGETIPFKELLLVHVAYLLLQFELAGICFGISAFTKRCSVAIGIGIGFMMYFMNLVANMSEKASFLSYFTPYSFADGADIITESKLDPALVCFGLSLGIIGIVIAYIKYSKKDIS